LGISLLGELGSHRPSRFKSGKIVCYEGKAGEEEQYGLAYFKTSLFLVSL
jgi:hypothetical protein